MNLKQPASFTLIECLATLFQGECEDGSVGGRVEELHGRGRRVWRGRCVDGRRAELGLRHAAEVIADDEQVPRRNQGRGMRWPINITLSMSHVLRINSSRWMVP